MNPIPCQEVSNVSVESSTKRLVLQSPQTAVSVSVCKSAVQTQKPRTKRVITGTDRWTQQGQGQDQDLCDISGNALIQQQIRLKISGYRSQDVEKGILDLDRFVCFQDVVDLFRTSEMACYYCREPVMILYEYVREPKQWTLERLDNDRGHNRDNVVLACLRCNLRRRCMNTERYIKTKEMAVVVKLGGS